MSAALPRTAPARDPAVAGPADPAVAGPADPVVRADPADELREALVADLDAGFAALVRAHGGVVWSVALRTTGRAADAEDLAADALLRAYRALRGYDAARIRALAPRAWLLTIVVNTRRNQVRDAARRPAVSDAAPPDRPAPEPGPEDAAANTALGAELAALLARLPEVQRTAVVLRHVVDLPLAEVAAVLGCAEGTARSHVSRGLARLRTLSADAGTTLVAPPGRSS